MTDVFISYSRSDKNFVSNLFNALESKGIDTWVDWQDIEYAEDWWQKICAGIEAADNFVFVITPESVRSKVCFDEIQHAVDSNKRIVPVLHKEITEHADQQRMHPAISRHNWLPFTETAIVDRIFSDLLDAINRDPDHVKAHTRLLVRAREWETKHKNPSLLLRGDDLQQAEIWLTQGVNKEPAPTDLHAIYISASRSAQRVVQRRLLLGVSVALLISLALMVLSFFLFENANRERQRADNNAATAEYEAHISESLALASDAQRAQAEGDTDLALALALHANQAESAAPETQRILAEIAYELGTARVYRGHEAAVWSAAFSPDERLAVSGGGELFGEHRSELFVWDVYTLETLCHLEGHDQLIRDVAFTTDGRYVLSASDDPFIIMWDVATCTEIRRLEGHTNYVFDLEIASDGRHLLSSSADSTVILWDLATGEIVRQFPWSGWIWSLDFSPDERSFIAGNSIGEIALWDIASGRLIRQFERGSGIVHGLDFDPTGKTVLAAVGDSAAGAGWSTITRYDVETGQPIRDYVGHHPDALVYEALFSPDGSLALSGGFDDDLFVWDTSSGIVERQLKGHDGNIIGIDISADGRRALTASGDHTVRVWNLDNTAVGSHFALRTQSIDLSADGRFLLYDNPSDGYLAVLDVLTQQMVAVYRVSDSRYDAQGVAFSPAEDLIMGALTNKVILWNRASGEIVQTLRIADDANPSLQLRQAVFSPDGRQLAAVTNTSEEPDASIVIWNIADGTEVQRLDAGELALQSVNFSPDGTQLVTSGIVERTPSSIIDVWDLATGDRLLSIEVTNSLLIGAQFSLDQTQLIAHGVTNYFLLDPQQNYAEVAANGSVLLFDSTSGSAQGRLDLEQETQVRDVALSRDGQIAIIVGSQLIDDQDRGLFVIWEIETGQIQHRAAPSAILQAVDLSDDGFTAATKGGGSFATGIMLWHVRTGDQLLDWIYATRHVHDLTCEERRTYRVAPLCEQMDEVQPTPGRILAATPSLTPLSLTYLPATQTLEPFMIPTPTLTLTPLPPSETPADQN